MIYLHFSNNWKDKHETGLAVKMIIESDIYALRVTRKCPESALVDNPQYHHLRDHFIFDIYDYKPYVPHFNINFISVNHDELVDLKELSHNVKVISLHEQEFVHKFITPDRYQNNFEIEVDNYKKLADAS